MPQKRMPTEGAKARVIHPGNGTQWITPAGIMALIAISSVFVSVGWNYEALSSTKEMVSQLRIEVNVLKDKETRVVALEVKLDNIQRSVDEVKATLAVQPRPTR